ncbi:hypothetical protein MKW98_028116 [Papaver atlanticum]|uniref:Uncharacterized protein n=1 Tax=Papaver atlanticum TaxID=357466 RepID=A0AAD4SX71_9MAGN|nr:hypothetical protein MKW98_028116 [Papaver atlanticum]
MVPRIAKSATCLPCKSSTYVITRRLELHLLLSTLVPLLVPVPSIPEVHYQGLCLEEESGKELAQVVSDPSLTKAGVYWSWNKLDSASFENQLSLEV